MQDCKNLLMESLFSLFLCKECRWKNRRAFYVICCGAVSASKNRGVGERNKYGQVLLQVALFCACLGCEVRASGYTQLVYRQSDLLSGLCSD
jgi:hypothetical protein